MLEELNEDVSVNINITGSYRMWIGYQGFLVLNNDFTDPKKFSHPRGRRYVCIQGGVTAFACAMKETAAKATELAGVNESFYDDFMQLLSVAPASRDFMGQGGVCHDVLADSPIMVNVIVIQKSKEPSNFNI
jgi:hypothetical protein